MKSEKLSLQGEGLNIKWWYWPCRVQEVFLIVSVY